MKTLFLNAILITSTMIMASEYGYEATPIIGYNIVEKNLDLQNQFLYGGELQLNTGTFLDAEFSILYANTIYLDTVNFPQNTDILRYTINGIHRFDFNSIITPIIKVGIGFEEVDISLGGNRDSVFVDAGLGAKVHLSDSVSLKAEAVYMMKYNDTRKDKNIALLAGTTYSFGNNLQEKARIVKLLNSMDKYETDKSFEGANAQYAETIKDTNTEVYQEKYIEDDNIQFYIVKTMKATNTEVYQEKYTEDDNIQFPIVKTMKATNAEVYQKNKGNDETINTSTYNDKYDYKDYIKIVKTSLNFRKNSFAIDERVKIKVFIDFLNTYKNASIEIIGHASLPGTRAYNQLLSEKRARSVKEILIKNGIEASRINIKGKGEDEPIINNSSRYANKLNRRIEISPIEN